MWGQKRSMSIWRNNWFFVLFCFFIFLGFLDFYLKSAESLDRKGCSKEPQGGIEPTAAAGGHSFWTWGSRSADWATGTPPVNCFILLRVSQYMTTNAASRSPHDALTERLAEVSSEHFLSSNITHIVNCKRRLVREQLVVCHVSRQRHSKNLCLYNELIWHEEHFTDNNIL